jgi:hypothetical protein
VEAQIDAPTDAATGAVRKSTGQKRYLGHYMYRAGKSARQKNKANARTNNYPFFTAPKFRASVGEALRTFHI